MKKWLRRIAFMVLAGALVATLVALRQEREARESRETAEQRRIEGLYRRIDEELEDVDVSLSKLTAAASPRQSVLLLGDVWRATGSAGAAMAQLPLSHADTNELTQFITRCGDYAHVLMGNVLKGRSISDEDREQLAALRTTCAQIRSLAGEAIAAGTYIPANGVDGGCYEQTQSEAAISEYPTLIYDGPFSESGENRTPACAQEERITAQEAQRRALKLFPDGQVTSSAYVPGSLPVFTFTLQREGRGEVSVSLTEAGGHVLSFMGEPTGRRDDPPSDEESEALKAVAQPFLEEMGFEQPVAAYAQYYQGVAVLNYAPQQAGVILYGDLIKVYIDRDTEEVVGMDARNYCLNHRTRELPAPRLTAEQAEEYVSGSLRIQAVRLALIPLTEQTEALCYECKATREDTYYIVYINALTGEEEQIFQVIDSERGDLVV